MVIYISPGAPAKGPEGRKRRRAI